MEELTAREENEMLEEGRERDFDREDKIFEVANEVSEGQYEGYLRDNEESLKDRYIE